MVGDVLHVAQHALPLLNLGFNTLAIWRSWHMWRRHLAHQAALRAREADPCHRDAELVKRLRRKTLALLNEVHALKSKASPELPEGPADSGQGSSCDGDDEADGAASVGSCSVCWQSRRDVAFNCGHLTCDTCSLLCDSCPICRQAVNTRTKVFL